MPGRDGRETMASITEAEPLAPVTASTSRASEVGPETRPDVPPTDPAPGPTSDPPPAPATDPQPQLARLGSNPATEKSPELDFIEQREQDGRPPRLQSFSDEGTSTGTVEQTVLDERGPAMAAELAAKTATAPKTQESAARLEAFAPRPRPSVPIPLYPRSGSSRSLPLPLAAAEIARREESTPEEGTVPGMPAHEEALESPPPSFVTSAAPLAPPSTTRSPATPAPPSPSSPETTRDEHTERMDVPIAEAEALVATFGNAASFGASARAERGGRPAGPSPSDAGPIPFDPLFSVAGLASTNRSQRLALMLGVGFAVLVVLVLGIRAVSSSSSAAAAGSSSASASASSPENAGAARTPRTVVATPVGFDHTSGDDTAEAASAAAGSVATPAPTASAATVRRTDEEDPLGDVPSRVPAPAGRGRVPGGGAARPAAPTRSPVRAGRP